MSEPVHPPVERTLGRWDLVLLKIVAIVNLNNVPATAVYGWFSILLWLLAFVLFFVPEAIAVLVLSRRYPGEGGIYLWIRQQFGEAHGEHPFLLKMQITDPIGFAVSGCYLNPTEAELNG